MPKLSEVNTKNKDEAINRDLMVAAIARAKEGRLICSPVFADSTVPTGVFDTPKVTGGCAVGVS
jgi:hypothetical protein